MTTEHGIAKFSGHGNAYGVLWPPRDLFRVAALVWAVMSCAIPEAGAQSVLSITPYTAVWSSPGFLPTGRTTFLLGDVRNETGRAASFDATGYLREELRQRLLKDGFSESSDRNSLRIDVSIRLFQEGDTFGRWLGGGAGAAYCVAYAELGRDQGNGAEAVLTSAITHGGVFSAGAEKTVLEDIAAEVVRLLLSGESK